MNISLPDAACEKCKYTRIEHEGLHCYMFKDKPGSKCAQYCIGHEDQGRQNIMIVDDLSVSNEQTTPDIINQLTQTIYKKW